MLDVDGDGSIALEEILEIVVKEAKRLHIYVEKHWIEKKTQQYLSRAKIISKLINSFFYGMIALYYSQKEYLTSKTTSGNISLIS